MPLRATRSVSLRTRLLVSVLAVFAIGLFLALGATWAALQDSRRAIANDVPDTEGLAPLLDELVNRTVSVAVVSTVVALLVVAATTWLVVRRGLRPLEDIAETAAHIDTAALGTRVSAPANHAEVARLADALNTMLEQIERDFAEREQSEQRLRRFVADASHELRTPIATIRGYAELFRRGGSAHPDDLATILTRVESEAERMGTLVDEMLLLARLDQGTALAREPVDLREVVFDAVAAARVRDPRRSWNLRADHTVIVTGDAHRMRQVVDNLLANVTAHTGATDAADIALTTEGQDAVLEVRDHGPGISEQDRARVFDPFYRAAGSAGQARGGAGLGLSIVAGVIAAHTGVVRLFPTPVGTTVHLTVPLMAPC